MSDDVFEQALERAIAAREKELGRDLDMREIAFEEEGTFYELLESNALDPLIARLHDQHGDSGGLEMIDDVRYRLERENDTRRLQKLLAPLVAARVRRFFAELPHARAGMVGNIANAARFKAEALALLDSQFQALYRLGQTDKAAAVKAQVLQLYAEQKPELPPPIGKPIDEARFWTLIEGARQVASSSAEFGDALVRALVEHRPAAIKRFEALLQERLAALWSWDLWALAYLAGGGCSDDGFDYFRAWIVAQGRPTYERALADPDALAADLAPCWDLECEELLGAADQAYALREGDAIPVPKAPRVVRRGKAWKESDLPKRYSRWHAKFSR